jgi:hypothetical protein
MERASDLHCLLTRHSDSLSQNLSICLYRRLRRPATKCPGSEKCQFLAGYNFFSGEEENALSDTGGTNSAKRPTKSRRHSGWAKLVTDVKRKLQESESQKAKESAADRAARRTANATYAIATFTIVLAIVGALTLVEVIEGGVDTQSIADAARKQARASQDFARAAGDINGNVNDAVGKLQDQVAEQRTALRISERPWLKFEMEGERPPGIDPNNAKAHIIHALAGHPLKVQIKVTNVGRTTAENLLGTLITEIVSKDRQPIFQIKNSLHFSETVHCVPNSRKNLPSTGWREGVLYPQEVSENEFSRMRCSEQGTIVDDPVTQDEQTAIEGGRSYVLSVGEVWYSDVFGVRHWTRFCQMANAELNVKIAEQCARFGALDNEGAGEKPK